MDNAELLKNLYRRAIAVCHPDRAPAHLHSFMEAKTKELNAAYRAGSLTRVLKIALELGVKNAPPMPESESVQQQTRANQENILKIEYDAIGALGKELELTDKEIVALREYLRKHPHEDAKHDESDVNNAGAALFLIGSVLLAIFAGEQLGIDIGVSIVIGFTIWIIILIGVGIFRPQWITYAGKAAGVICFGCFILLVLLGIFRGIGEIL